MSTRYGNIVEKKDAPVSHITNKQHVRHQTYQYQSRNDYTVGWICTVSKELTAATAMLDHIHADLPNPPDDRNTYTLGSIGKHKIVIACLPKGVIGTDFAATSMTQMARSFPSVKVGLLVGIGSGIRSKFRLGDVVVGTPVNEYEVLAQWELWKKEDDGVFGRTGGLDSPPSAMMTALTKMETRSRLNGYRISQYLENMGRKWPSLVPEYTQPPLRKSRVVSGCSSGTWDRLHAIGPMLWEMTITRFWNLLGYRGLPLKGGTGDMSVHYGLITSSNGVIKDAEFRERLTENLGGNVLCIDMDEAGLTKDFPFIVIRGICNYADSEKSKGWQEYAAAVAAACAKELLQYVQSSDVDGERSVLDILNRC